MKKEMILLVSAFILSGCERGPKTPPKATLVPLKSVSEEPAAAPVRNLSPEDEAQLERCRKQLDILQRVDNARYLKYKGEFVRLSSGASLYFNVRNDVNVDSKDTLDAMYKFKLNELYYNLSWAVMDALSTKGGE